MLYIYIFGTILFTVYGQLILKWRIVKYGALPDHFMGKVFFFAKAIIDPYVFSGLLAAFVASLFWMAAMTKADVSFAYPFITAGLTLLTVLLAVIILGEPITWLKSTGILLIISGVVVMAFSNIT